MRKAGELNFNLPGVRVSDSRFIFGKFDIFVQTAV